MMKLLDETCSELSRNGLKKIILLNSHGGNTHFLEFFCQSQLMSRRDYSVILFQSTADPLDKEISSLKRTTVDGHAGEEETSMMYFLNPDYVDKSQIGTQSGADLDRLSEMKWGFTAIWWFAKFPNHYAGDGGQYNSHLGELLIKRESSQLADLISYLKRNNAIQTLQNEFYDKTSHPLKPR
jgi:creatinine amidohydrolase